MLHIPSPTSKCVLKGLAGKLNLTGVEMRAINYNATQQRLRNEGPAGLAQIKIQEILDNVSQVVLASIRTGYQYILGYLDCN
jgi:hypothetical protein